MLYRLSKEEVMKRFKENQEAGVKPRMGLMLSVALLHETELCQTVPFNRAGLVLERVTSQRVGLNGRDQFISDARVDLCMYLLCRLTTSVNGSCEGLGARKITRKVSRKQSQQMLTYFGMISVYDHTLQRS